MALTPAERTARYKERHPERVKAAQKSYAFTPEGAERRLAAQRAWAERNRPLTRTLAGARTRRTRDERMVWLGIYKLWAGCIDCSYRDDPRALQFDHVRGEKIRAVSSMVTCSLEHLIAEIEKCDVRCANCHIIKTHPDAWRPQ